MRMHAAADSTTVHFVYPHGPRIACPDAIGRKVGQRLGERGYRVLHYDLQQAGAIVPGGNDILLGHPHMAPWTVFRRSAAKPGWRRILALSPFCHGDDLQCAFLDPVLRRVDQYLAITGRYWYDTTKDSRFAHWLPKMVHIDLAVDRADFPPVKTSFAPPGRRRFVYIGHTAWFKNCEYLSRIAAAMPEAEISWIGRGKPIANLRPYGPIDFSTPEGQQLVAGHDVLLTVGKADANPTTILESMAWGLIPACTSQSGYSGHESIINVPLDDVESAVKVLRALQRAPEGQLRQIQAQNWRLLEEHFNWDRLTAQVIAAMESDASPPLGFEPVSRRAALKWAAISSPNSMVRPMNLARCLKYQLLSGNAGASGLGHGFAVARNPGAQAGQDRPVDGDRRKGSCLISTKRSRENDA